jgi:hypothetical protein
VRSDITFLLVGMRLLRLRWVDSGMGVSFLPLRVADCRVSWPVGEVVWLQPG